MKYVIIHGHFYQPPRENPYLNIITKQNSAAPAHDWNERITNECYAPNAYSRLLDRFGRITSLVNNYEYMSYNFGPTLLDYIAEKRQDVLERIVEGDKKSIQRLGHGNAIAQVYNHIIMPLANKEDMYVQTQWAIYNFEKYFSRFPEGIWLSETAINSDTISVLARCGIKFVVLSPFQAHYVKNEEGNTVDVSNAHINTSIPYRIYAEDGSNIIAFFYDAQISQAIAFEHILRNADVLASRINSYYYSGNKMLNLATDGESYGHHEPFGDMCLSRYFTDISVKTDMMISNYAHYLSITECKDEAILHAGTAGRGTSWSCAHGVERWINDCGCSTGGQQGWNQEWRKPLRESFDILRQLQDILFDIKIGITEQERENLRALFVEYIYDNDKIDEIYKTVSSKVSKEEFIIIMEAYKYAVFAYTSCGWFFADISGIEPVQNMRYANKSFLLLREFNKDIEIQKNIQEFYKKFCDKLALAKSNIGAKSGLDLFREVEAQHYDEYHVINHGLINMISEKGSVNHNDICKFYEYCVEITKVDEASNLIYGQLIHKYMPVKYFVSKVNTYDDYIENSIKISEDKNTLLNSEQKVLSIKDIISEDREEIASVYLSEQIKIVSKDTHELMGHIDNLIDIYFKNGLSFNYDFDRILGALYCPILREYIESQGQGAYEKVSTILHKLRSSNIHVSTSAIGILIENAIYNKLVMLSNKYSLDLVRDIFEDIKFVTSNEIPITRYKLENMFYIIASKIYNDIDSEEFTTLGIWLNFAMDDISF